MNNNKNITVKQAIDRYIESKTAVLSPSTIYGYKKANQRYLYILHDVKIAKLDQDLFSEQSINYLIVIHLKRYVMRMVYCTPLCKCSLPILSIVYHYRKR